MPAQIVAGLRFHERLHLLLGFSSGAVIPVACGMLAIFVTTRILRG
jgi:hypothetical protein